jgi:hypothetical protein
MTANSLLESSVFLNRFLILNDQFFGLDFFPINKLIVIAIQWYENKQNIVLFILDNFIMRVVFIILTERYSVYGGKCYDK